MESQMKENMKELKTLILDQFSSDVEKFNKWSRSNYEEVKFLILTRAPLNVDVLAVQDLRRKIWDGEDVDILRRPDFDHEISYIDYSDAECC